MDGATRPDNHDGAAEVRAVPQSAAEREWRRALRAAGYQVAPMNIPVHPSQLVTHGGDKRAAETAYRRFVAAEPDNQMALAGLEFLLQHRGAWSEMVQMRRQRFAAESRWLGVPDEYVPAVVEFLAASLGDGIAPAAPPPEYIARAFDDIGPTYDRQLADLGYCGPALLREAVQDVTGIEASDLDVLDLGCGTGPAGAEFRQLARGLTGVDLSRKMLDAAQARGVYDELHQAEITDFLEGTGERFDLIVAADALSYLGNLSRVLAAIAGVLRPGGHCAATFELGEAGDYRLDGTRRYQHSREYVERAGAAARLDLRLLDEVVLRTLFGNPVRAWCAVWRARG